MAYNGHSDPWVWIRAPDRWESHYTICPVFDAFCWIEAQQVDLRFALQILFLNWARWHFILFEFSQPKSDLAIPFAETMLLQAQIMLLQALTHTTASLTIGATHSTVQWPHDSDSLCNITLSPRQFSTKSPSCCCKWSRTPQCVRGSWNDVSRIWTPLSSGDVLFFLGCCSNYTFVELCTYMLHSPLVRCWRVIRRFLLGLHSTKKPCVPSVHFISYGFRMILTSGFWVVMRNLVLAPITEDWDRHLLGFWCILFGMTTALLTFW